MGQEVDADAEGAHLAHGLDDLDLRADLVQAEGGGQAADAGADDHAVQPSARTSHNTSWTSMVTTSRSRRPVETARMLFSQSSRGADVVNRTCVRK